MSMPIHHGALRAAIEVYASNERLSVSGERARSGARSVIDAYLKSCADMGIDPRSGHAAVIESNNSA